MKMNLDKWTKRALKKVEKMSPQQKIAMLAALDTVIRNETGRELLHLDISWDLISEFACAYDIDLRLDDEDMKENYEDYEYTLNPDNVVKRGVWGPEVELQVFNGENWVNVEEVKQ